MLQCESYFNRIGHARTFTLPLASAAATRGHAIGRVRRRTIPPGTAHSCGAKLMGPHHSRADFAAALATLSDRQRAALRLVARGHDSKTIAPQFGKSHHTIHKDLERAMNALGARDRFEAARWVVDFEGDRYEAFVYEPQSLPYPSKTSTLASSEMTGSDPPGSSVNEERAQFTFATAASSNGATTSGADGQIRNRLHPWQLVAIAIAGAVAVVVVLAGMLAVSNELQPLLIRIFSG